MVKKIGSVLVAAMVVLSISMITFAAPHVSKIDSGVFVTDISYTSGDSFKVGSALPDIYEDFKPGEKINIYLDPSKFSGTDIEFTPEKGMSAKDLENAGISYKIGGDKNTNLITNHSFQEKDVNGKKVALIQIKLTDRFLSTELKEFEATLTIYADKVKQQSIKIGGTLSNTQVDILSGDKYINLGDGDIGVAKDNVNDIEVYAGNDITIHAKLVKGRKYYAVARLDATNFDIEVMDKNPEIDSVYQLDADGFLEGTQVTINSSQKLYAYNESGKLLGTTEEKLPMATKYYLANKEINLAIDGSGPDDEYKEPDLPDDSELPTPEAGETGNESDIPDTGVGIGPQLAMAAVVVGLATIGVVTIMSRRKK